MKYILVKMEQNYFVGIGFFYYICMYVVNDGEYQGVSFFFGIYYGIRSIQNYNGLVGLCDNFLNVFEQVGIVYGGSQLYNLDVVKEIFIYFFI